MKRTLFNVSEALNTKQPFLLPVYFGFILYITQMNGQERAAFWKLSLVFAQNHYSFPCGNSKHCMFSACIYNTKREGPKEKYGGIFFACKTEVVKFPLDKSTYLSFSPTLYYLPHRNTAQTPALTQTYRVPLTKSMIWTR